DITMFRDAAVPLRRLAARLGRRHLLDPEDLHRLDRHEWHPRRRVRRDDADRPVPVPPGRMTMRFRQPLIQRIDRRRFLGGAGGAMLALPMLEAHAPRLAFGASTPPPQRLIVILHGHGRVCGGNADSGAPEDNWSPLQTTGALPTSGDLSPL